MLKYAQAYLNILCFYNVIVLKSPRRQIAAEEPIEIVPKGKAELGRQVLSSSEIFQCSKAVVVAQMKFIYWWSAGWLRSWFFLFFFSYSSKPCVCLRECSLNEHVIINIFTCSESISSKMRSNILWKENRNMPKKNDKVTLALVWWVALVFKAQQDVTALRLATSRSIVFHSTASLFLPPLLILKLDKGQASSAEVSQTQLNDPTFATHLPQTD